MLRAFLTSQLQKVMYTINDSDCILMGFFCRIWSHGTNKTLLVGKQHSLGAKKKKKRIQGFPQAIKNVTPSYFRRRIEEK